MSKGGPRTSAIPRPKDPTRAARRVDATEGAKRTGQRTADLTRPIPAEKQLVKGRATRRVLMVAGMLVVVAIVASLFVLPIRTWLHQDSDIARKQQELAALEVANAQLADEVAGLGTPDGIADAAREEIGYIRRDEQRLTVLGMPDAPLTLPTGWPYEAVAGMITVRQQAFAAAP